MNGLKITARALSFLAAMTMLTGVLYTGAVTVMAQVFFPFQANGGIVETDDGGRYSLMLGQSFEDSDHMWGRMQSYNVETFTTDDGEVLAWAGPRNLSPAGDSFEQAVSQRIDEIREAHPEKGDEPIPSDLVTMSGSGLDPHISIAAAEYQVERLAKNTGKSIEDVEAIVKSCTEPAQLGVFGEPVVNVLKVNLMLEGKLDA